MSMDKVLFEVLCSKCGGVVLRSKRKGVVVCYECKLRRLRGYYKKVRSVDKRS